MKCIYRKDFDAFRCNKLADFILFGKSYCKKHMELRANEWEKARKEAIERDDKITAEMKYQLQEEPHICRPCHSGRVFFVGVLFASIVFSVAQFITVMNGWV